MIPLTVGLQEQRCRALVTRIRLGAITQPFQLDGKIEFDECRLRVVAFRQQSQSGFGAAMKFEPARDIAAIAAVDVAQIEQRIDILQVRGIGALVQRDRT